MNLLIKFAPELEKWILIYQELDFRECHRAVSPLSYLYSYSDFLDEKDVGTRLFILQPTRHVLFGATLVKGDPRVGGGRSLMELRVELKNINFTKHLIA